jgi:hypothetical protein
MLISNIVPPDHGIHLEWEETTRRRRRGSTVKDGMVRWMKRNVEIKLN